MKRLLVVLLTVVLLFSAVSCGTSRETETNTEKIGDESTTMEEQTTSPVPSTPDRTFEALTLPSEAIKTLGERGLTPDTYMALAKNGNNGKMDYISTMQSPDYTLTVNGTAVPVYCTLVYVSATQGAIQSFATVFVNTPDFFELDIVVTPLRGLSCESPVLLKEATEQTLVKDGNTMKVTVNNLGNYTFLRGADNQDNVLTVFVKENVDDDARIASYQKKYGNANVQVYDAGVHEVQNITMQGRSVLYLRKGALLVAKPSVFKNDSGLIEIYGKTTVLVTGYGVVELSLLDHSEKIAIRAYASSYVTLSQLTFVNSGSWNIYFYNCSNCNVTNVTVLGHRMNSDGINMCNSRLSNVKDCWIRTGDDCFSAKTLGGDATAVVNTLTFTNCTAWAGKARCFGVTGEAHKEIKKVTFKDCAIVFQDAVWDKARLGGLVVILESGSENNNVIQDILFDGITVYDIKAAPLSVNVYGENITGLNISVTFKNIVCKTVDNPITFYGKDASNTVHITLDNVTTGGVKVTDTTVTKDQYVTVTTVAQ